MAEPDDGSLVVLVAAAAVVVAGYGLDLAGLTIHPWLLAAIGLVSAGGAAYLSPAPIRPRVAALPSCAVALAVFAYALWLAFPEFLPVTNGPDVVHHLQLIHVLSATGRLPHDAAQSPYLLEMMHYTPGSHVLAAAIGAWVRVDPLFAVYPIAAGAVAIKAAMLYELTRRVLGSTPRASLQSFAAPILAFVPVYFLGAFVQFFFFAQVVSETFAVGLLLSLVAWQTSSKRWYLWTASACGAGVVLCWPVWIVPAGLTAAVAVILGTSSWRARLSVLAIALGPALVLAVVHQARHLGAASIVTSAGAVTEPSIAAFGLGLLIPAAAGAALGLRERAARPIVAFLAATLLVSGALAVLALRAGSPSFYMPFKMMYLAILPAAVLGAIALARGADLIAWRVPGANVRPVARTVAAALVPLVVAGLLARGRVPTRRPHGSLTTAAREVALRARDTVPPECIDYFSSYWLTGYWLHLDVLGNPRLSDRMRQETFDFPDVAAKWVEGRGLPYAIVEDMSAIPREIRPEMEPLHQRGSFVLVRNTRPAACAAR